MFKVLQDTRSEKVACGNVICLLSLKQGMEIKQYFRFIPIFMAINVSCMYLLAGNLSGDR